MNIPTWLDQQFNIKISSGHRLQWEKAQNCFVLLYPEGMIKLNDSAAEILQLCDGTKDINTLITTLQNKFNDTDLKNDVYSFLEVAHEKKWITSCSG